MLIHENYEILKKTVKFFEEKKIPYWLHAGTLLGLYRDKELISYDGDVDLGMYETDSNESMFRHYFQQYMNSIDLYLVKQESSRYKYIDKTHKVDVDLFFFKKESALYYHEAYRGFMTYPLECLNKLSTMQIDDTTFSIPSNPELFLQHIYGTGWTRPNADFHKPKEYRNWYSKKEKMPYEKL